MVLPGRHNSKGLFGCRGSLGCKVGVRIGSGSGEGVSWDGQENISTKVLSKVEVQ